MYSSLAQSFPQETHLLLSTVSSPVHWLMRIWGGGHDVKLQAMQPVSSAVELPWQKAVWIWPAQSHSSSGRCMEKKTYA